MLVCCSHGAKRGWEKKEIRGRRERGNGVKEKERGGKLLSTLCEEGGGKEREAGILKLFQIRKKLAG